MINVQSTNQSVIQSLITLVSNELTSNADVLKAWWEWTRDDDLGSSREDTDKLIQQGVSILKNIYIS